MNSRTRIPLIIGLVVVSIALAFPPFERDEYYSDRGTSVYAFILSQPTGTHLNISRLTLELLLIIVITSVAYLMLKRQQS